MSLQSACAGCSLTQEALFKSQWKRREESILGEGGDEGVLLGCIRKQTVRPSMSHSMLLLFSLLLFHLTCLHECRLRSSCSAHSELIDPQLSQQKKHLTPAPSLAALRTQTLTTDSDGQHNGSLKVNPEHLYPPPRWNIGQI